MTADADSIASGRPTTPAAVPARRPRVRWGTLALLVPAILLSIGFLYYPLVFIVQMSFTEGSSFLSPDGPVQTLDNYTVLVNRYLPNLLVTLQLAVLATIVDL